MANNYVPKAALGSLLLAGAGLMLDPSSEAWGSSRVAAMGDSEIVEASDARTQRRKLSHTANMFSGPNIDREDSDSEESDMEVDIARAGSRQNAYAPVSSIPRMGLRHPDEQAWREYRGIEDKIRREYYSVENDEVDFGSILLLVSLANECLEVARESYIISSAEYQTNWFERSMTWSNKRFKRIYRISTSTFERLSSVLSRDPIFTSPGPRPQRPVKHQLATFLLRYGYGYSNAYRPHADVSIGEGSVFNYCRRVVRALRLVGLRAMGWPNDQRKAEIKEGIFEKTGLFDNCIGVVDGSLIHMLRKPREQGDEYFSRKKRPCINVMTVVDHEFRVINCEMGWPGSKNDAFIWRESWVWANRGALFRAAEYLLGDKGYPLSPYLLRPYSETKVRAGDVAKKRRCNKMLSRGRIVVEMTFGQLKMRFPSLHCMGAVNDINDLYRCVQALMVLHNLCIDYGDSMEGLEQAPQGPENDYFANQLAENDEEVGGRDENETDRQLLNEGKVLRDTYLGRLR